MTLCVVSRLSNCTRSSIALASISSPELLRAASQSKSAMRPTVSSAAHISRNSARFPPSSTFIRCAGSAMPCLARMRFISGSANTSRARVCTTPRHTFMASRRSSATIASTVFIQESSLATTFLRDGGMVSTKSGRAPTNCLSPSQELRKGGADFS